MANMAPTSPLLSGTPPPTHQSETASTDSEAIFTPDVTATPSISASPAPRPLNSTAPPPPPPLPMTTTHGSPHPPRAFVSESMPELSRSPSFSGVDSGSSNSSWSNDEWDSAFPPLDRLGMLDMLDGFALPQRLEKLSRGISAQTEKVRKSRDALRSRGKKARERMVEEWRRRVPSAEEQLERYRKRMNSSMDKLGQQWNDTKIITAREKISFICGVMNIFISAYLLGGRPEWFPWWYTAQVVYFMPIRWYTYHQRGYHYFLADLCYFTNFLLLLSLWVLPGSKRLFTATYCLAFGNNAVAIVMWRNSLVFHSFDKVTSLFIHIMPCATLHCIVHLYPLPAQQERFPAIWTIKTSLPGSPTAYANVVSMLAWSTLPYAVWQLMYYVFISVRRRDKIAAGRPTSFTWLRKIYADTALGRAVLALPAHLQEPAFMLVQYLYAALTMLPCPIWFYSRWASAAFLMLVFTWSVYNGSTYYIDVFGKRFQKELEAMKAEVAKWQASPDALLLPTDVTPSRHDVGGDHSRGRRDGEGHGGDDDDNDHDDNHDEITRDDNDDDKHKERRDTVKTPKKTTKQGEREEEESNASNIGTDAIPTLDITPKGTTTAMVDGRSEPRERRPRQELLESSALT